MENFVKELTFWRVVGLLVLMGALGTLIVRVIIASKTGKDLDFMPDKNIDPGNGGNQIAKRS